MDSAIPQWTWGTYAPRQGDHLIVFAEMGFSMLDVYGHLHGNMPREVLHAFADSVNTRDEPGTLLPTLPLTAIPRKAIRDSKNTADVYSHLLDVAEAVRLGRLRARRLVFDFSPALSPHTRAALRKLQHDAMNGSVELPGIEEVLVVATVPDGTAN